MYGRRDPQRTAAKGVLPARARREGVCRAPAQRSSVSNSSPQSMLLHLQRTVGNRAVQRLVHDGGALERGGVGIPVQRVSYDQCEVREDDVRDATTGQRRSRRTPSASCAATTGARLMFGTL